MKIDRTGDPDPKLVAAVTVEIVVPHKRLSDLLIGAIEGGSREWYWLDGYVEPKSMPIWVAREKLWKIRHAWYPLAEGGALYITDSMAQTEFTEGPMFYSRRDPAFKDWVQNEVQPTVRKRVDLPAIVKGVQVMARAYPRHFRDFMEENDDASTADVFLQCVVFGKVIYG